MQREPQIGHKYRTPATGHVQRDGGGRVTVTINTADLDRHGTVIDPQGAELAHYKNNPIVLAGHSMTKVLGTSDVRLEGGKLVAGMTRWSESDVAQKWKADVEAGIVRAASIGFRVLDKEREQAPDGTTYTRITRWQLVEWSWVAVPSNPHATTASRSIQPLTLRGDGSKSLPKHAPINFSDEQFERLISGRVHADVTPGANTETGDKGERPGGREGIVRGAHAVFGRPRHQLDTPPRLTDAQRRHREMDVSEAPAPVSLPDRSRRYALPHVSLRDPADPYRLRDVQHEPRLVRACRNVGGRGRRRPCAGVGKLCE